MKNIRLILFTFATAFGCGFQRARANRSEFARASQLAVVKQRIGVTDITITYHRPLVKGRKIWGGLVPMDKVWRAGANENTHVRSERPDFGGRQTVAERNLRPDMIPSANSWTIIFSKMAAAWGSYTYDKAEDALRVEVKPLALAEMEEALEYQFENPTANSVTITMKWEKVAVPIHVTVNDAERFFRVFGVNFAAARNIPGGRRTRRPFLPQ